MTDTAMALREQIDISPDEERRTPAVYPVFPLRAPAGERRLAAVLARGLAGLVTAQRCFAEEFGLAYGRVFSDGYEAFKGCPPEEVLREWLAGGEEGMRRLQGLFDDLARHQLALVGALDGVALEAMALLERGAGPGRGKGRLWPLPGRRTGEALRRRVAGDFAFRHARVVLPGGAHGYVRAREAVRSRPGEGG